MAQPAHGCHCNAEQGGFCPGSWDLWVLPITCVLKVYLSTSAGTFKHLICTFSTSFLWLNGLGEFGASLQSPLHVEAAWRGRHLRRKIIRAGHLPSTSICQRHLLEQPTATLGHLRTQPKATIGHLGPPLASWVSASTHLRAINSTRHKPPDISDKIQTMDIQMFFLEMSLISLSALDDLNWAQLIADSSLKWSHIFFPTKTPSQRVHLIKEFPPNDFEHRHLSPTFSHYLASQSFTTLDSQARLSYAVSAFRCSPAFSDLSCGEAPIEINLEQIQ